MTQPSPLERKHAAKQALAMVTAIMEEPSTRPDITIDQLLREVDDIPLVLASLVGLISGLLHCIDERHPGASEKWLQAAGLSLERM